MIVDILEYRRMGDQRRAGGWMLFDAIGVSRTYDEEFLTTSVEGTDELFDPSLVTGGGDR